MFVVRGLVGVMVSVAVRRQAFPVQVVSEASCSWDADVGSDVVISYPVDEFTCVF